MTKKRQIRKQTVIIPLSGDEMQCVFRITLPVWGRRALGSEMEGKWKALFEIQDELIYS